MHCNRKNKIESTINEISRSAELNGLCDVASSQRFWYESPFCERWY
jgi:hypothetical protein